MVLKWYKKAAVQNHASSMTCIGALYKIGNNSSASRAGDGGGGVSCNSAVRSDHVKAVEWFKKGAEHGCGT